MADGRVNITFSTVAQLGGLNALSAGVKTGGREFKDFGEAGAKVVSALKVDACRNAHFISQVALPFAKSHWENWHHARCVRSPQGAPHGGARRPAEPPQIPFPRVGKSNPPCRESAPPV